MRGAGAGIRFNDRVFVVGDTGSGKSELLNLLLAQTRVQKLLLDTKGEFSVPDVTPARSPDAIDWRLPLIHYVDLAGDLDEYDELFQRFMERRNLVVCVHELADLCADSPGATPRWVGAYIRKGRAMGLGMLGGSQRPVGMPRAARAQAQHVFAFAPELDPPDHKLVASMMRLSPDELSAKLDEAAALSPTGQHSYVWFDRRAQTVKLGPPLPGHMRRQITIRRTEDA